MKIFLNPILLLTFISFPNIVLGNLLVNPGFETDSNGWTIFGNANIEDWADQDLPYMAGVGDGDFGIALEGWISNGSGGFFQDISGSSIVVGNSYTFSGNFHHEPGFNPRAYRISLQWWDLSTNDFVETSNDLVGQFLTGLDASNASQWQSFSVTGVTPHNTDFIRALVKFEGTSNVGGLQAARVDNMSLTMISVPAPATIWLFGAGLIGLARFGKRK